MKIKYFSVCSGMEAASEAWIPLGWEPVGFSEIEPFPCAVLAHHHPTVPNHGDMTKFKEWPDANFDVLCGGTPCQSFSVAGLRKGLDDPRGNLMLTFGAIADRYRPKWLVWENVPGVLSSNRGRDFGAFLGMLGGLGYGFAYRVLDAQYFGLAQRRKRVFVVGYSGKLERSGSPPTLQDLRRFSAISAGVLFERNSLSGNPVPSRKARQEPTYDIAPSLRGGGPGVASPGDSRGQDPVVAVAPTLDGHAGRSGSFHTSGGLIPAVSAALVAKGSGYMDPSAETYITAPLTGRPYADRGTDERSLIAHTLRGEGFDASEDGTGRGTPLVPVAFDTTQITNKDNRSNPKPGDPCHPLASSAHIPAIAFPAGLSGTQCASTEERSPALGAENPMAVAFESRFVRNGRGAPSTVVPPLKAQSGETGKGDAAPLLAQGMSVRRLTPVECHRLQGFRDRYLLEVLWRGRVPPPDGPMYKALGNSWAVKCARWIGERIEKVESIINPN